MRNHKLFCIAVFSLTLAGLLSVAALGQSTNATISGTVSDETGGVVPGVEVLVTHLDRGTTRTIVSDDEGRYSAPELQLGSYQVEAALTGFQTAVRTGITLTVGRHAVVDLVLSIGEISERVVVTGEVATVETTSSTISGLVDAKKIRDLPLNGPREAGRGRGNFRPVRPHDFNRGAEFLPLAHDPSGEIQKCGRDGVTEETLPQVVGAGPTLIVAGCKLRAYLLDDGRWIVDADDATAFFETIESLPMPDAEAATKTLTRWVEHDLPKST